MQLSEVAYFIVILVVFMLAYAVAAQALQYPDRSFYWGIFGDIIYYPYWQLYGELNLEQSIEGTSHKVCTKVAIDNAIALQANSTAATRRTAATASMPSPASRAPNTSGRCPSCSASTCCSATSCSSIY